MAANSTPSGPPSDSPARRTTQHHFFKIMLPSSITQKKLRIPGKFVRMFGHELSTVAKLSVPNDRIWHVGLEKANNKIWFCDGWKKFVDYHSIDYGYFLVFRYEGNSKFHVLIFDTSASEIQYPYNGQSRNGETKAEQQSEHDKEMENDNFIEISDSTTSSPSHGFSKYRTPTNRFDPLLEQNLTGSRHPSVKHGCGTKRKNARVEDNVELRDVLIKSSQKVPAAKKFKTSPNGYPYFMVILKPHNLHNNFVYIPTKFAGKYLNGHGKSITLEASNGKQWQVKCIPRNGSRSRTIGIGWNIFYRDNNLKLGDVCLFELIKRKNIVLKVSVNPGVTCKGR